MMIGAGFGLAGNIPAPFLRFFAFGLVTLEAAKRSMPPGHKGVLDNLTASLDSGLAQNRTGENTGAPWHTRALIDSNRHARESTLNAAAYTVPK